MVLQFGPFRSLGSMINPMAEALHVLLDSGEGLECL